MALIPPVSAESVRNGIRRLRLPRPLNIFLFGFDNGDRKQELPSDDIAAFPSKVETVPKRRGPKPGTSVVDYDELGRRLEEWCSLRREFPSEISTDRLAEEIGYAKVHVLKYFGQHIRKDFRLWKLEKKIACAQRILRERPDMLVSDVAVRCGFNNTSNFFRQFRRIAGCTPQEWRNPEERPAGDTGRK